MRRAPLLLVGLLACQKAPPGPRPDADAGAVLPLPPASAKAAPVSKEPSDVVLRWNAAHAARDASALESIYADEVSHYGTAMKRDAVVKAKAASFAEAPDFTQSIGRVDLEPGSSADQTTARFTKTVTQKGKTQDYPAVLVVRRGLVESENDDVDWCLSGDGTGANDLVVRPFEMSALEAIRRAYETKHFKDSKKRHKSLVIDIKGLGCAKVCAKPSVECGFRVRTSDLAGTSSSNLVEWLYIDPFEKKLWFYDFEAMAKDRDAGEIWKSEPLPPLPAK